MLTTREVQVDYFILSETKTGAFFNNSWRISHGGQWRVAAATILNLINNTEKQNCSC
jgi:hypothetical protein